MLLLSWHFLDHVIDLLIKISAADFTRSPLNHAILCEPRKGCIYDYSMFILWLIISRGYIGHIMAFHTVDTETDCAKGQGGYLNQI